MRGDVLSTTRARSPLRVTVVLLNAARVVITDHATKCSRTIVSELIGSVNTSAFVGTNPDGRADNFPFARHRLRTATIPASGFQRRFTEAIA